MPTGGTFMRNRRIFSILAAIVLMLSVTSLCVAEDNKDIGTPEFLVYYAAVSHVLKHDQGCFDELMSSEHINNIASFWWGYIMKECFSYMSGEFNIISNTLKSQKDIKIESEKIRKQCAMAVIYDNWDRINFTIVKDPAKECIKKKVKP
jgi:hypothetical protein